MNMLARAVLNQQGAGAPVTGWVSSTTQGLMSNVTNHVVSLPSRSSGDIMVVTLVDVGASAGWVTPAGWTLAATQSLSSGLDLVLNLYYRVSDAAEGATVTFVNNGSSRWVGTCDLYRGFASVTAHDPGDTPTSDFDASDTLAEWTGTPSSMDSGDLLVSVFGVSTIDGAPTALTDVFTEPSGTTVRTDYRLSNGSSRAGMIILADRTATGSDTAGVWTSDAGNANQDKAATSMLVLNA